MSNDEYQMMNYSILINLTLSQLEKLSCLAQGLEYLNVIVGLWVLSLSIFRTNRKKLPFKESVPCSCEVILLIIFPFFSYCNFEDIAANFENDRFREESLTYKQNFKRSVFSDFCFTCSTCIFRGTESHSYEEKPIRKCLICFQLNCQTEFSFCLLFCILRIM